MQAVAMKWFSWKFVAGSILSIALVVSRVIGAPALGTTDRLVSPGGLESRSTIILQVASDDMSALEARLELAGVEDRPESVRQVTSHATFSMEQVLYIIAIERFEQIFIPDRATAAHDRAVVQATTSDEAFATTIPIKLGLDPRTAASFAVRQDVI